MKSHKAANPFFNERLLKELNFNDVVEYFSIHGLFDHIQNIKDECCYSTSLSPAPPVGCGPCKTPQNPMPSHSAIIEGFFFPTLSNPSNT